MKAWRGSGKDPARAAQALASPGSQSAAGAAAGSAGPPAAGLAGSFSQGKRAPHPDDEPEVLGEFDDVRNVEGDSDESEWDEEDAKKADLIEDSSSLPEAGSVTMPVAEEDLSVDDKSVTSASALSHKPLKMTYSFWGKRKFGASGGARKSIIRVQVRKKEVHELVRVSCAQVLTGHHTGPVWVLEFSLDGHFMSSAGKDGVIHLWEVQQVRHHGSASLSPSDNSSSTTDAQATIFAGVAVVGPLFFSSTPKLSLQGHTADVTCVAWNASGFLVSASVDKTARVWHSSTPYCLAILEHPDFVTGVDIHPVDDHLVLTGCLDKQLRLWDVASGTCLRRAQTPAMITCVKFNLEGDRALAGLMSGNVFFFQMDKLHYYTQVECRGSKGLRKVTSLRFFRYPGTGKEMLLVTCNDNRTRLYNVDDFSLVCKYRGALNSGRLPIGARCSNDGRYLLCGSEDKLVVLWRTRNDLVKTIFGRQGRKDMCDTFESFHASQTGPVTVACFAPVSSQKTREDGGLAGAIIVTASEGTIAVFENDG